MVLPLALLLLCTALLVGTAHRVAVRIEPESRSRRLLLVGVLVPAEITVVVLGAGWVLRWFSPLPVALTAVAVGLVVFRRVGGHRPSPRPGDPPLSWATVLAFVRRHPAQSAIVAIAAARLLWQAVLAAVVPISSWDSLWYHLPEPSTWVLEGRIVHSGLTPFGDRYPQGQEVLHAWTMVFLHTTRGTGLVVLWLVGVGATAVYRIARVLGAQRPSALVAAAVFASMPAVVLQVGTAYVDVGAAAFALAALAFGLDARSREEVASSVVRRHRMVAGAVAAGLAIATKPSMVPVALVWVACALSLGAAERAEGRGSARGPLEGMWSQSIWALGLLGGFWYVWNLIAHRNPVYPLSVPGFRGAGSFDELVLGDQAPDAIRGAGALHQMWTSWIADLRWSGLEYTYDQRLGGFGPVWVLMVLPALVLVARRLWERDRFALLGLAFAAVATSALTRSIWWSRYTLVLAGVGAAALAVGLDGLGESRARVGASRLGSVSVRRGGVALAALAVLVAVGSVRSAALNAVDVVTDDSGAHRMRPSEIAAVALGDDPDRGAWPWFATGGFDALPPGATVAVVRPSPILPQALIGEGIDRRVVAVDPMPDAARLRAAVEAAGAEYLYLGPDTDPDSLEWRTVTDRLHARPVPVEGPLDGGTLWRLGDFGRCQGQPLAPQVEVGGAATVVHGRAADACGPLAEVELELWALGPDVAEPWAGARAVLSFPTDAEGRFLVELDEELRREAPVWCVRFAGEEQGDRYRPTVVSPPLSLPG